MTYIWESNDWPHFSWDGERILEPLARVSHEQGLLLGRMEGLGFDQMNEAQLHSLTDEVMNSSEIEGESLPQDQVRSSIARHLEMKNIKHLVPSKDEVDSVVGVMTDATKKYDELLTPARLLGWQASLFTSESLLHPVTTGRYRNSSMQVISGAIGREKIHFEAPPSNRLEVEMSRFLGWFESPGDINPILVAGLAHFWFVTIHPFDDGNGRIARAIADMAMARAESSHRRFYSMSKQILKERNDYYKMLEQTQKGGCDITAWQEWFLGCLLRAIQNADKSISVILQKSRFWQRFAEETLNERQIKMLNMLFDGFNGKLKTEKWAKITKCSPDTALRDIKDLINRGALKKDQGGGRSTSYSLVIEE